MRVVIIGGGLGGLCLAQGLRKNGFDVAVFEREDSLAHRGQGYRLHVDASGQAALRACLPDNVWEAVVATCCKPTPTFYVANEKLSRKFSVDIAKSADHTTATAGVELVADRLTLRSILASGLGDVIHFGRRFARFEHLDGGEIDVHFADGGTERCDLLVGADGITSAVRQQYLPEARMYDTHLRTVIAKVPLDDQLAEDVPPMLLSNLFNVVIGPTPSWVRRMGRVPELMHLGIAGAPKYHCAIGPFRFHEPPHQIVAELTPDVTLHDTRDYAMCTFGARVEDMPVDDSVAMAMSGEELKEMSLGMLDDGGWDPAIQTLIENWDVDTITYQVVRSAIPGPAWRPTSVTLMGDAIHAMSITGGQGANTAFRDASLIVQALRNARDGAVLEEEIGRYEASMREYSSASIKLSASRGTRLVGQTKMPKG